MIQLEECSPEEYIKIDELKSRFETEKLPKRLEQDQTLFCRFLRARDFDVNKAETLLRKHISDRSRFEVDKYESYIPPKYMVEYFPVSYVGLDKEGSPITYMDSGKVDTRGICKVFSFLQLAKFVIYTFETQIDLMTEETKKRGKQISRFVIIVNMNQLNLYKVTHKQSVQYLLEALKLFQDNYPERIKAIYIINAAYYFTLFFAVLKGAISSVLLDKIQIFGFADWKEFLREKIDPDDLPAFLGGNKTDPDGNPLCESFIAHGKLIPEELYPKNQRKYLRGQIGVEEMTISQFSSSEVVVNVEEAGTNIEWEFETKAKDIAFSLCYEDNSKEEKKIKELLPKERIDTDVMSEVGFYKCKKPGKYMLVFDNSYSWLYSKKVYYRINITKPVD